MAKHPLNAFMSALLRIDEEEGETPQPTQRKSFNDIDSLRRQEEGRIQIVADNAKSFQRRPVPRRSRSEGKQRQRKAVSKQPRIEDLKIKESRWESGSRTQPLVQCGRFTL